MRQRVYYEGGGDLVGDCEDLSGDFEVRVGDRRGGSWRRLNGVWRGRCCEAMMLLVRVVKEWTGLLGLSGGWKRR